MKKALKITCITLASLLGVVLVVVGVAVAVVTSSDRLTQMVKKYAPEIITCEMQLDKVGLTLFKTFPNVGINIEHFALINPIVGSISDTLANIDNLVLVVDADKFRKEKEIVVKKCIIENAFFNIYIDSLGQNNFNVLNVKDDNDSIRNAFDYLVDIEGIKLKNASLLYADDRSRLKARMEGLNLDVNGKMQGKDIFAGFIMEARNLDLKAKNTQLSTHVLEVGFDGKMTDFDQIDGVLEIGTPNISLNINEPYLKNDTLLLNLPIQFGISDLSTHLENAQIGLNRNLIAINGHVGIDKNKDVELDLGLCADALIIEDVIAYLPNHIQQKLNSVECSGEMNIVEATVRGTCNDSIMPLVTAKITTDKARINVADLPYPFTNVNFETDLFLDLNNKEGNATINGLHADFNQCKLTANGVVSDFFDDIALKLRLKGDVPMTDLKSFLPESIHLGGHSSVNIRTDFTVNQLMKSLKDYSLNRLKTNGALVVHDFAFEMDTIHVSAPQLNLAFALPASSKMNEQKGVFVDLASEQLETRVGKTIVVEVEDSDIKMVVDKFKDGFGKMNINADLRFGQLNAVYDSVVVHVDAPIISVVTKPEKSDNGLDADISFEGHALTAALGESYSLNAHSLEIDASINQNKAQKGFLNHWNPSTEFGLNDAVLKVDGLEEDILISNIDFIFDSQELDVKKSTFLIGKSDLSIQGNLDGIKEWMDDHKNLMKGEFQLSSRMLDVNEIMDLTSGWGTSDASDKTKTDNKEDNPFMVPEGVDFGFSINTQNALFDNFELNNLGGRMIIKDGTLILQEIGFTNKAAEMQLTAMYQSPRRNNLFLAMDFHLLNVQINDLLHMIPYIDTLVPMLKTFDGQAEFHIGAETNLKANYEPKISTLRAAADIEGKNLIVNDRFTFTEITDKLRISTNGEYRIDSLNVQMTAFKDEIDLWPSQVAIGKYKVTLDGRMTLDKNGEYHLSVTESPLPARFGLSVSGPLNNLDYTLEKPKFPTLYKPNRRSDTDEMYLELKKRIADRLKENVR